MEPGVCDARAFADGDLAILVNGAQRQLLKITSVQNLADHGQPCQGQPNPNRDKLQHNNDKISGQWTARAYMMRARLVTWMLKPDPVDTGRTVLFRRVGLATAQSETGIVAFDVTGMDVWYGIARDPTDPSSKLVFYATLQDAVSALGSTYTAVPSGPGTYVGTLVRAVRVELHGASTGGVRAGGPPGTFDLVQTVDLRG